MIWKLQLAGFLVIVASGLSACASSQNPAGEPRGSVIAPDGLAAQRDRRVSNWRVREFTQKSASIPWNHSTKPCSHSTAKQMIGYCTLSPPNGPTLCQSQLAPASVAFSRMSV
jgi:hypothetical protein